MRGIRLCLIVACCCGLMLSPSGASADDWQVSPPQQDAGESVEYPGHGNRDPYPTDIEDLGDLSGPFDRQFPDLPLDDNPFYHAIETDRAAFTPALSTAPLGRMVLES